MRPLGEICSLYIGLMALFYMIILLVELTVVVYVFRHGRSVSMYVMNLIRAFITFGIWGTLEKIIVRLNEGGNYTRPERFLFNTPWLYILLFAVFQASVTAAVIYRMKIWRDHHLTRSSIREAIGKLKAGICVYTVEGIPVLVNPMMEDRCTRLTGKPLLNGNDFWDELHRGPLEKGCSILEAHKDTICTDGKGVYRFEKNMLEIKGETVFEIISLDVTAEYEAYKKLEQENRHLRSINGRMRRISDTITRVTIQKEVFEMKLRVHDNLGQTLLAAKHYLLTGKGNLEELMRQWGNITSFMKKQNPQKKLDEYEQLRKTADDVGVRIIVDGTLPEEEEAKKIVATGIHECMTNVIRHAEGDELYIDVIKMSSFESGAFYRISFRNNGKQPEMKVKEKGGLAMLRKMTENYGGSMEIESSPEFCIRLSLPVLEVE